MRRRLFASVFLAVLVCSMTACPTETELDRAAKASREIAYDVKNSNIAVGDFYKAGKLSLAAKDKAAVLLGQIEARGQSLNNYLIDLDKKYPKGTPPPQNVQFIKDNIGDITTLFKQLFNELNLFGATEVVKELKKDVETVEKVGAKL